MERSRTARPTASAPAANSNAPVPELSIPASFNATHGPRCDARTVLRCLLVDDNASFLNAAKNLLDREGLDVVGVAMTADGALQQVEKLRPDLVLLDIVLGTESGFDVSRRLSEAYPEMTIILVSTHAEADFADLIAEAPVAGFVPKSELSGAAVLKLATEPRET